jgi:MFS family permease
MMSGSDWHKPRPERLPQPSYAPAVMAVGLTCVLWGVVTSWIVSAIGFVVTGVATALWIGDFGVGRAAPRETTSKVRAASVKRARHVIAHPWLHRSAVLLAIATLALVVIGAGVTSQAGRPWEVSHLVVGATVGVLTLILAMLLRNRLGWILLAAVLVQAMLGNRDPAVAAFHAFLAQMFFAATVAVALMTSRSWKRDPEVAQDMAKPSLHTLSLVTVILVVAQVALGAAVRHKVMGAGIHITGALVVALAIVILGMLVTNQFPTHRILRPTAIAMMVIAGTQVFLGFGAFIVRMMVDENTLPVRTATMAHVTTGALTLASTVVLALEIRRNLRPAARA